MLITALQQNDSVMNICTFFLKCLALWFITRHLLSLCCSAGPCGLPVLHVMVAPADLASLSTSPSPSAAPSLFCP